MSTRFFTSDTHLQHRLVAGIRGYWRPRREDESPMLRDMVPDTDAHDAHLAAVWDAQVGKNDEVYILGDIAMNAKPEVLQWFVDRPGRKHLISGNHDQTHPMHSKALRFQREWLASGAFETINSFLQLKMGGRRVALSHFPYVGEGSRPGEDRFTQWRLRDEGLPLLFGHTHEENVKAYYLDDHSYHVGLDGHEQKLVPESVILEWLEGVPVV